MYNSRVVACVSVLSPSECSAHDNLWIGNVACITNASTLQSQHSACALDKCRPKCRMNCGLRFDGLHRRWTDKASCNCKCSWRPWWLLLLLLLLLLLWRASNSVVNDSTHVSYCPSSSASTFPFIVLSVSIVSCAVHPCHFDCQCPTFSAKVLKNIYLLLQKLRTHFSCSKYYGSIWLGWVKSNRMWKCRFPLA